MGDLLMAGMLIGGVGGAIKNNSSSAIEDACNGFNQANDQLKKAISQWKSILGDATKIKAQAQSLGQTLTTNKDFYVQKKKDLHDAFRLQELQTMIMLGVFIFSIIFTLLMRYFNVYGNIWNLIVGNK